jgi:hypothetical protein
MDKEMRKHLVQMLSKTIDILEKREKGDIYQLKELSDHIIKDASIYQDIDAVQVAIIIYSLYKIVKDFPDPDYQKLYRVLQRARDSLQENKLREYNASFKEAFSIIRTCDRKICKADRTKEYVEEVFHAARIKKGLSLFKHGVSVGKAADMMGITTWDLMKYLGQTKVMEDYQEIIPARNRLKYAIQLFTQ